MKSCIGTGKTRLWSLIARLRVMVVLSSLALLFTGVSGCDKSKPTQGTDVLAVVNGSPISVDDFKVAAEDGIPKGLPEREAVLQQVVNRRLVAQRAIAEGYLANPVVMGGLEMFYATQMPDTLRRQVVSEVTVSDDELQKLKKPDLPVFDVDVIVADSAEQAEAALAELKKGAPFAEVAARRSTIKTQMERRIAPDDDLYPAGVKAVINRLSPGEVSPVMKMQMGYMVVRLKSKSTTGKEWEAKKEELRKQLKDQKAGQAINALVEKLRSESVIKIIDGRSKDGASQVLEAEVNGVTIKAPREAYKASNNPHMPHRGMTDRSLRYSLDRWVTNELLSQEARRRGLDKDAGFQRMLKMRTDEILANVYLENIRGSYAVTEGDIQDYYNKHKDKFTIPRRVRLSRILSPTKERAEEALRQVKSGKDFASVARSLSTDDSTSDRGGDVGFVAAEDLKSPLKETIANLKVGEISPILQSDYGFEILKATDIKEPALVPLSDVRDTITRSVLLIKKSERVESFINTLRQQADIKLDKERLKLL